MGGDQYDNDVALAGRVFCKVDATDMEIKTGDLLTTSDLPGYAMKACCCSYCAMNNGCYT